ncbi:coxI translation protein CYA5 [Apiospora rasikravindrae]|uniref:CoxI translation protein CYA5 n=1 Tax=Apiospora rasikravindrae TaxID=990691 RepID=A0ABR1TZI4_9PEZI
MLEKTAASLEPCGLQRVLPGATKSFQSRRQLHTAFWQHGAADVELSNAWQALMHGVFDSSNMESPRPEGLASAPAIRASTFLLDFLYPSGTVAFLRRFSPASIDRFDPQRPQSFAKVSPRLYTSSASLRQVNTDSEGKCSSHQEHAGALAEETESFDVNINGSLNSKGDHGAERTSDGLETVENGAGDVATNRSYAKQLATLLARDDPEDADQVWYHYSALDAQSREVYRAQTLFFLSKTHRVTDSWKITELFQHLGPDQWESYSFLAGLTAQMNLGNEQAALDIFGKGIGLSRISDPALIEALDMLLASALKATSLDSTAKVWSLYEPLSKRLDFEGITSQLPRVASVPGLAEKVLSFRHYFTGEEKTLPIKGRKALLRLFVRRAVVNCADNQVEPLLRLTKDPLAFEEFLRPFNPYRRKLHISVYKLYRVLKGASPSHAVLHETFRAYIGLSQNSAKLAGAELLWGDWHKFHESPSRRAFQKFLGFYASQGDKERVFSLWTDYMTQFASLNVLQGDDTFTHLLQVHAVREEVELVQSIFDDISGKFGIHPNRHCWNILLNAYVKAGDYGNAIRVFDDLSASVGPDRYSYGTLMQMAASRGDLGFTVDLYRRGRRKNIIDNDSATLAALVEGYCQNDHFHEAEDVCIRSAKRGLKDTWLWNRLLHAYGIRRNLASINRLLNVMTDLDVPYDDYTYQELLLGLALCRQPQHALALLAVAIKERAFEVQEDHFNILMGAFIKTGEPHLVVRVHKLMEECGIQASSSTMAQVMTALTQWHRMPPKLRRNTSFTNSVAKSIRAFYKSFGPSKTEAPRRWSTRNSQTPSGSRLLESDRASFQISRLIYLFTQMKDMTRVQELVDLYREVVYGDKKSPKQLPIQLLDSMMWAEYSDKNYEGVRALWDMMFATAKEGGLSADWLEGDATTPKISPRHVYVLSGGLEVMQHMCMALGDALTLQKLVEEVRTAGFEIDSKNWNLHVQYLVRLKVYEPAFDLCEQWLMPNWTGWAVARAKANMKNELPLDLRRRGAAPRFMRIVTHTLYYLARGYMELERMSPWSAEAARLMRHVESGTPRCYRAIMSMTAVNSDVERQILEGAEPSDVLMRREGVEGAEGSELGDEDMYTGYDYLGEEQGEEGGAIYGEGAYPVGTTDDVTR